MTPDQLSSLLLPLLLVVVFWLLVIRPARRRQRDVARTQASLQPGSRVMLSSGVFGDVASIADEEIRLTVAPGVTLSVHRQAVAKVVDEVAVPGHVSDASDRPTDR